MPRLPDGARSASWRIQLTVIALISAGYCLTLVIFYPGVMTFDAKFVYEDIAKHALGDWQSPVMTVLWALIDPIAPGSGSMFFLIVTFYWLGFGLLAMATTHRSIWLAMLVPILALMPPAFIFVGIIWRDVLFATTWLLAAVIVFASADRGVGSRLTGQAVALLLCALGVLLRPNALIAAPVLCAYIFWPTKFSWKRTAIVFIPVMAGFFILIQLIYYGALGATRQHPLQSIMVFDLGGISHFTKQNQFPVTWSESESALLLNGCYKPTEWDIYWRLEPCEFVMHKIEKDEKLFGTPAISNAWMSAVLRHPVAYLEHRGSFMWKFLAGSNFTMWLYDIEHTNQKVFQDRRAFVMLEEIHDVLKPTPLFRAGTWLLVCAAVCGFALRWRNTPEGAFAIGICGTATLYVATFFAVGVASDFRYAYLAVLAGIAGGVALLSIPRSARTALL